MKKWNNDMTQNEECQGELHMMIEVQLRTPKLDTKRFIMNEGHLKTYKCKFKQKF